MTNPVGNTLSRLIKERAYLSGAISAIENNIEILRLQLNAKVDLLNQQIERLNELDARIIELSAIDVADIRAIKSTARVMKGSHGELKRALIDVLKCSKIPVTSGELVKHIAEQFSYPLDTPAQRRAARNAVICPLNLMRKRGAIVRLPSLNSSQQGRWQWVGAINDSSLK